MADLPEPNPQEWEEHYDLQGNKLDSDKVRAGKQEEIDWILKQDLFHYVPERECYERQGRPYTLKWVLRNKGDKVRARIVVREIKKAKTEDEKLEPNDVFSAMPPVESLKALVSHVMTEKVDKLGRPLTLAVFDVSRAHLYGARARDVYVQPPSELARPGFLAKLNKTMYGTQDASNVWQKTWGEQLQNNGYKLGGSNPSFFCSEHLKGFCHGDDFTIAAAEEEVERFNNILSEKFEIRQTGMVGHADHLDKELEVLHRTVRIVNDELMVVEADQKHVPLLLEDLGLSKGNAVKTPRVKLSAAEAESIESSLFEGAMATAYRSGTMRAAYLGQDRVDIAEKVKCLSRAMAHPREGHLAQLKRLARYLKGAPRCALRYRAQSPEEAVLAAHVDSDWAGDPITRRSTTGVILRRGSHLLRHSSTVQAAIGLAKQLVRLGFEQAA